MPSERADARMRMFNADGSEGEMCGNGVRCVGQVPLRPWSDVARNSVTIETGRGMLTLDLEVEGGKRGESASTWARRFSTPRRFRRNSPGNPPIDVPIKVGGLDARRHGRLDGQSRTAVTYVPDVELVRARIARPSLEHHPAFPRRVNVHVVEVIGPARSGCAPGSAARGSPWRAAPAPVRSASPECSPAAPTAPSWPTCPAATSSSTGLTTVVRDS